MSEHRPATGVRSPSGSEDPAAAREARAFGIAVHRAMETVDLRTGEEDRSGASALHQICTQAAREAGIAHGGGEVLEAVSRALRSPVISRARRSPWIRREVPFLVDLGGDGSTVSGAVDLVFEEDGGLVIVDFKTDRVKAPEVPLRAASYRPQLLLYAQALGRLSGKEVRSAVLVFTSPGVEQSLDLRNQET